MAEGVDDSDADEDGGHVRLPPFSSRWLRQSHGFLPDSFVDEEVGEDQEDEGSKAEKDGCHGSHLRSRVLIY